MKYKRLRYPLTSLSLKGLTSDWLFILFSNSLIFKNLLIYSSISSKIIKRTIFYFHLSNSLNSPIYSELKIHDFECERKALQSDFEMKLANTVKKMKTEQEMHNAEVNRKLNLWSHDTHSPPFLGPPSIDSLNKFKISIFYIENDEIIRILFINFFGFFLWLMLFIKIEN